MEYMPRRVYVEEDALAHPLGKRILDQLRDEGITDIKSTGSHNRVTGIPGTTPQQAFREGKGTLVVGVKRSLEFQSCKPSAHYQLPLVTGCPGMCQYCYLNTHFGKKPYVRIYVNTKEILDRADRYAQKRKPEETLFEGAATSDPLSVEKYTGALREAVEFAAANPLVRFRFVTKYTSVESLLNVKHAGRTEFRFSINTRGVIQRFEHRTPSLQERLNAAVKVQAAGYPLGFLVAPIMADTGWQDDYSELLQTLGEQVHGPFTLELITHRYTNSARNRILEVFPRTQLDMDDECRRYKYGQFGYGKYVYPQPVMKRIEEWFRTRINDVLPDASVQYLV